MCSADEELAALINSATAHPPISFFSTAPCKDSIPVRRFSFGLEEVVTHLNNRFDDEIASLMKKIVYKQSGPQRHQLFWRKFRCVSRYFHKYNGQEILRFASDLLKKISGSSSYLYMPTIDTIRFLAASILSQLFLLEEIRRGCIEVVHGLMGQLEMGHWEKMSIFLVALCGEIFSTARDQARAISTAYDKISEFLLAEDTRWPTHAKDIEFVASICEDVHFKRTSNDVERVRMLMKMTDEEFDAAILADRMESIRKEVLSQFTKQSVEVDLGVSIARDPDGSVSLLNECTNTSDMEPVIKPKKAKKRKSTEANARTSDMLLSVADTDSICSLDTASVKQPKISSNDSAIGEFTDLDVSVFEPTMVSTPYPKKMKKLMCNTSLLPHKVMDSTSASEFGECPSHPKPRKMKLKKKVKTLKFSTGSDSAAAEQCMASDSLLTSSALDEKEKIDNGKLLKKRKLKKRPLLNDFANSTLPSDSFDENSSRMKVNIERKKINNNISGFSQTDVSSHVEEKRRKKKTKKRISS